MRLNWFSPLLPARTGIAEFTAQLLPALCDEADVVLWTDQEHWDRRLERVAEVRRFHPASIPWPELHKADLNVYQMGNSEYHIALWQVSRQCPGVMVLHDLWMSHFCRASLHMGSWEPNDFIASLKRVYDLPGEIDPGEARHARLPAWLLENYPLTEPVVGESLGVVVHTRKGRRCMGKSRAVPVIQLPLPYPATTPAPRPQPESARGGPFQLVIFGHLGSNRGLPHVLDALAAFPWRDRFTLNVYGNIALRAEADEQIRRLNLGGLVRIHGSVSDTVLDAALDWADLAINLRYPSMGEASHSQLR